MELRDAAIVAVPPLLNRETVASLSSALDAAAADRACPVIVLLGGEEVFCRGLDLSQCCAEDAVAALQQFAACLRTIRLGDKPVIGLVRGAAVAGGVGLAAACDGLLATADATFVLTELLFGLVPAVILPYLAQRISMQKLRWMALRAETLSAREAQQSGLADQVCAPEDAPGILRNWVRQLRRAQPSAAALWKRMTFVPFAAAERGEQLTLELLRDSEVRRAMQEFLESGELPFLREKS